MLYLCMPHHVFSQHLYRPATDPAEGGSGAQLRGRVGLHYITDVHGPSTLLQDHLFPALYCTKGRRVVHVHRGLFMFTEAILDYIASQMFTDHLPSSRIIYSLLCTVQKVGGLFMFTGGCSCLQRPYWTTLHHRCSQIIFPPPGLSIPCSVLYKRYRPSTIIKMTNTLNLIVPIYAESRIIVP